MLSRQELKQRACAAIDRRKVDIVGAARQILNHPEPGFREVKTAQLVADQFAALGIPYRSGLALTGVKGRIPGGGGPGPRLALIGELDSLIVNDHPHAAADTGAAHACGHHCQIGMMLGATMALTQPEILDQLSGELVPFAVPAEEFIEVAHRLQLRDEQKLEFMGGKQELIRLGEFDDVDLAMMCHTASDMGDHQFAVGGTSNGHVVKYVQFIGRGAHAGSAPHLGVNALNAASFALQAIHNNREAFRGEDTVRIHGIMTKGGEAVNAVPADVRLEWRTYDHKPHPLCYLYLYLRCDYKPHKLYKVTDEFHHHKVESCISLYLHIPILGDMGLLKNACQCTKWYSFSFYHLYPVVLIANLQD